MQHAFDGCEQLHDQESPNCSEVYSIQKKVRTAIEKLPEATKKDHLMQLDDFVSSYEEYLGHILRTKHQGEYYR